MSAVSAMDWTSISCCLLAFLLYYNTLDAGFVYDDRRAIIGNPDVVGGAPLQRLFENDFWGTPLSDGGSHGSYRPLSVATFRLNHALAGLRPVSYHLLNVLLHCLASALVVRVARRVLPHQAAKSGAAVAGLVFAAHPAHTEAVAGVVGRADLAACNLFLLSFLAYTEHVRARDAPTTPATADSCRHVPRAVRPSAPSPRAARARCASECCVTADGNAFRISCHSLVQQILCSLRKLVKASSASGPLKLLAASVKTSGVTRKQCRTDSAPSNSESTSVTDCNAGEWRQWGALFGCVALAAAAMLCKEPGVTVLPVCAIYDFVRGAQQGKWNSRKRVRSVVCIGLGMCAAVAARLRVAGAPTLFAAADNPAARDASALTRTLTFAYLPVFHFMILVCPTTLSFDWSMDAVPKITTVFDLRNLVSMIFYIILTRVTWRAISFVLMKRKPITAPAHMKHKAQPYRRHNTYNRNNQGYYASYYTYETKHHANKSNNGYTNMSMESYYHSPYREQLIGGGYCSKLQTYRRKAWSCPQCRHAVLKDHSESCRVANNNNSISSQHATCTCASAPRAKAKARARIAVDAWRVRHPTRSPHSALLMALAFLTLPFLPATNLFFYVGFVVAERVLYLPSVGYCLLVGLGAGAAGSRRRGGALALLLLAFSARTVRRNLDWRDEESLFRSAVNVNPPKAYGNLGSVLSSQGRLAEAEVAYRRALAHRPNMADVHYNLGVLLHGAKQYEGAIKSFERAIHYRPSMALAYVNLGVVLASSGRAAEAAGALRAGARADGARVRDRRAHDNARVSALAQLGALHAARARWRPALAAYEEALDAMPPDEHAHDQAIAGWTKQRLYLATGEAHSRLLQWAEAERACRAALELVPAHAHAHLLYAKLLARNSSRALEAEHWLRRASMLAPDDVSIRQYFGEFLTSQQRHGEAAAQLVHAAELAPASSALASAAARALRHAERATEAETWYARAVQIQPQDAEHHSNLGAILHLNGKYAEATASYRRALRLQPGDDITLTNLKRVRALIAEDSGRSPSRRRQHQLQTPQAH